MMVTVVAFCGLAVSRNCALNIPADDACIDVTGVPVGVAVGLEPGRTYTFTNDNPGNP